MGCHGFGRWIAVGLLVATWGCDGEERRPDTGYGANQPVPVTINCTDMCTRLADCLVALCNEDTHSTRYDSIKTSLLADCAGGCIDADVQKSDPPVWSCLFQSSCREVIDYSICYPGANYHCF